MSKIHQHNVVRKKAKPITNFIAVLVLLLQFGTDKKIPPFATWTENGLPKKPWGCEGRLPAAFIEYGISS